MIMEEGERALFCVLFPPRGASPELLGVYSARATATVKGRCFLCDAAVSLEGEDFAPDAPGSLRQSTVVHEDDRPACDDRLRALVHAHWATGRNEPCPCGSGRKFKLCHLSEEPKPDQE
jgi:hypothetical protein